MNKLTLALVTLSLAPFIACGGGTPSEQPATSQPAPQQPPPAQPQMETPPPNNVGPGMTPPPSPPPVAPDTSAAAKQGAPPTAKPAPPARPIFTKTDLQAGKGAEAIKGMHLLVNYTGWLYDPSRPDMKGQQFDSSVGRAPFDFVLGAGMVIPGWDEGFGGMKVGGKRRLIIPPDMGYGAQGAGGVIPPNATLLFEMELLDVTP
jgi:FKBP-type peptidyl-prolyl cis-trans isomerase FkpA